MVINTTPMRYSEIEFTRFAKTSKTIKKMGQTGNYYYGARYYNPKFSIWLSVDPLTEKYPSHSAYNYTLNNPINFVDPDGRAPEDIIFLYQGGKQRVLKTNSDQDHFFYVNNNSETSFLRSFTKNSNGLINLPKSYSSNTSYINIGFKTKKSNLYIRPDALGSILGALSENNISDLTITNASTSNGASPSPSHSHKRGIGIDFRYLRKDKSGNPVLIYESEFDFTRQNNFNKSLKTWGFQYMLSEHYAFPSIDSFLSNGGNLGFLTAEKYKNDISHHILFGTLHYNKSRHHNHLHLGGVSRSGKERFKPNSNSIDIHFLRELLN